ncbi:uncharacterized protein TRAVEDRAFT_42928 [Trametes versicolor FP-101664 SS1]|uniref:uncharacterized protein n=1 Tax=Trametes versicolor (strain FP-101664) TaxID=717944 RepID=UPI0004621DE8|nr:uncharacterized protein TRAVEDRAFT_42928 [Trametes versicolor FP-101664 SS1]EIW62570.1 hypothetical protein TRAVEDRAFT_42928 [Trametes versicolor FP-101664 SS1]
MTMTLNIQLSTLGVFLPERCLSALQDLYLSAGKSVADVPNGTTWTFGHAGSPTKAVLMDGDHPYSIRVIGVMRECCFDNIYPHFTIMPLFERDANVFSAIFSDPTAQDWEIEPDGHRPDVPLSLNDDLESIRVTDSTDLRFANGRGRPIIPRTILKCNDVVVAFVNVVLNAHLFSTPSYSFVVRHLTLVHSSTDREAGTL